jgi:hypothetical protein
MTVKSDAATTAAALTANAKAVALAKGASIDAMMQSVQTHAIELQRKIVEVLKLHPPVTRSVTVGGTIHTGDNLNIAITPQFGNATTTTYVVQAGDTLASAAASLLALINNGQNTPTLANATVSATGLSSAVFNLQYNLPPSSISVSVTGGGATTTLTLGSVSGSSDATNLAALSTLLGELL